MRYDRCNGLMVGERTWDMNGTGGDLCVDRYRGLMYGNLVDTAILENRSRSTDAVEPIMFRGPRRPRLVAG